MAGKPSLSTRERKALEQLRERQDNLDRKNDIDLALKLNDTKDLISILQDQVFYDTVLNDDNTKELDTIKAQLLENIKTLQKELQPKKTKNEKNIIIVNR